MLFISSFLRWIIPISIAIPLTAYWLNNKRYVFDEAELIRVTQKHIGSQTFGQDHRTAFAAVAKELNKRHGGSGIRKVVDGRFRWMWTRFGGFAAASTIIYSSTTEFIAFFGTAVETSGFTTRCLVNITATVVQGSAKIWLEGQTGGKRFIPGESLRLGMAQSSAIQIDSSSWMVVYGRGLPATCLPPIFFEHLLAIDFYSLWKWFEQITVSLFSSFVYPL